MHIAKIVARSRRYDALSANGRLANLACFPSSMRHGRTLRDHSGKTVRRSLLRDWSAI